MTTQPDNICDDNIMPTDQVAKLVADMQIGDIIHIKIRTTSDKLVPDFTAVVVDKPINDDRYRIIMPIGSEGSAIDRWLSDDGTFVISKFFSYYHLEIIK